MILPSERSVRKSSDQKDRNMSTTIEKPWFSSYSPDVPTAVDVPHQSIGEAWRARVTEDPAGTAAIYFDAKYSAATIDEMSDALAVGLAERGISKGSRVGIQLQNIPQFSISLLALWKLGAIGLLINPMYKGNEFRRLVVDSGAVGLIVEDSLYASAVEDSQDSRVAWILTTSGLDLQQRNDPRVFGSTVRPDASPDGDLLSIVEAHAGQRPHQVGVHQDDIALLTYTSGTTGPAKGATNTHGNLLHIAATNRQWYDFQPGDVMFAVAPLFHITGVGAVQATTLLHGGALLFANRPHPEVILELFKEHQVGHMIGSITVFNAIYQVEFGTAEHLQSAKALYSGGAPIPPATVVAFEEKFGKYIHNVYGMTETTSATIAVPRGQRASVDESSGSLSIGVPLPNVEAAIVDLDGNVLPPNTEGELELAGPQVVPGYWHNPEATEHTFPNGRLRTGDAAIMDERGWIYIVDRLKDQINVSGFKVWPREVEDVLYEHPAVYEAAVLGEQDAYRGETVVAYVSLKDNTAVDEAELMNFAKERLAAYKYPRKIYFLDDLPKTETGKIRRKALRTPHV
jgi:long-chain acyl-CoA synthetase